MRIEDRRRVTTQEIADVTRVPAGYLSKVLGSLARAGLCTRSAGSTAGSRSRRKPEDVSVLDVINAVDPIQHITTCPLGLKAHGKRLCPLHRRLDDAMASIEKAFGDSTLADLLADPSPSRPLCDVACLKK